MTNITSADSFNSLIEELNGYIRKSKEPIKILEIGAKEFVNDLSKLAKPYSKIKSSGYTHLVDNFCYEIDKTEIKVGWGKYYGRMVEYGTVLIPAQPHLVPLYEKNKEKYYNKMIRSFLS